MEDMEKSIYLLALNQLEERKAEENRIERSIRTLAKKHGHPVDPEDIGRYEKLYGRLEQFLLKQLSTRWNMALVR